MLKGTGVSEGIGIGRIFLVEDEPLEYTPKIITDKENEIKRLKDAIEEFCKKTEARAEKLRVSAGDEEAAIMMGHIGIARDPFLMGEVEKLIGSGKCAEDAFEKKCDMFIQIFSATDDDITKQRAEDVRDVQTEVLGILLGKKESRLSEAPEGTVICAREITPSMLAEITKENIAGILTETGSTTSHSAILARVLDIPAVMGIAGLMDNAENGEKVILDGIKGNVILSPDETQIQCYTERREKLILERREMEKYRGRTTASADGIKYELVCNIGKPEDAARALEADGEGVGLFRTEFLFMDKTSVPTEEEQFTEYKKAALTLRGRQLVIRTLDIGGDKNVPCLEMEEESNPFMGFRAIRFCLKNREIFRAQLRAILRASAFGNVSIMLPLITCVEEIREARTLVDEIKAELRAEGIAFDENIKTGIMAETSAAGVIPDLLAREADFFSIGTNDLTGYTMAADRGNSNVAYLYSPFQPSVLRMIRSIIHAGRNQGIPVGMCGEAASDPMMIPLLISFGLSEFSVSSSAVLRVRKAISSWTKKRADEITARVMSFETEKDIREYLETVV